MKKIEKWTVESSKILVDAAPFLTLRQDRCRLPDGLVIPDYNVISEPDIVLALVMTRDKQVVLVEQYKHGIGEICLELPGGLSDGGDPLSEIQREVSEETGYISENWQALGRYISNPTRFDNHIYSYIALDAEQVTEQHLDPAEKIVVHTLSLNAVLEAVQDGRISAVHSIAVIYQALVRLRNLV